MKSNGGVSYGSIWPRQPGSLWRATRLIPHQNFKTTLILLTSGLFLFCIFLLNVYWLKLTRPLPIIPITWKPNQPTEMLPQQDNRSETSARSGDEARGRQGQELVRNLIRDNGRVAQDDPFLVEYVRTHLLTPPSSLPYNLESKLNNTSQLGQNLVVLALLKNKKNGFFIECGAWDGEIFSNSLMLERDFGWTGLLIEADPQLARPLRNKNRKAWTSSSCLSIQPFPQVIDFYLDRKTGVNTLINNSYSMNQFFDLKVNSPVQVLCIPLYTYLLALKVDIVDYLSLDVEAADFAVLKTIPFDKIIFRVIEVEVHWVVEGKKAVRDFMESKGYTLVRVVGPDYIFMHASVRNPPAVNVRTPLQYTTYTTDG